MALKVEERRRGQLRGSSRPQSSGPFRMLRPQNVRSGCSKRTSRFVKRSPSRSSLGHTVASSPLAMEPPDTEEMVRTRESTPSSFSRRSAPPWNSAARNPPPERQSAMPFRSLPGRYRASRLDVSTARSSGRALSSPPLTDAGPSRPVRGTAAGSR